jgi:hypothetical protein
MQNLEKMENLTQVDEKSTDSKKPHIRSAAYPSSTIANCVTLTNKIDKEFTSVIYTPKDDIVRQVGSKGGEFLMFIGSCVQYGLLDLKPKEGYRPSELFKKIDRPLPNENPNDFLIQCFQKPDLYKKLIAEFNDKQLPSQSGLANILDRNYSIKGNAATKASKIFFSNLTALGLIVGNTLKIDSYIPFVETPEIEKTKDETPKHYTIAIADKIQTIDSTQIVKNKMKEIPVFLSGDDREAKVVLPIDFSQDDLKRIVKVIGAYIE